VNQLEHRVERLEQRAGVGQVDREFAASLSDEDRVFYLMMKAREAAHPTGFGGFVRTLDEDELIQLLALLVKRIEGADLDDKTRAEVAEMKRRVGM
jgi:hypothetical protein